MKIFSIFLFLFVGSTLLCLSCQNQQSPRGQAHSDAASDSKGEVLHLYTYRHLPADDSLYQRFQFLTGIAVNVVQKDPSELFALLQQGRQEPPAGLMIPPDVAMAVRAKEEGLLQLYYLPQLDQYVKPDMHDDYGYWTGLTIQLPVIAYASARVGPEGLASFFDLTEARWKGKVLAPSADDPYLQSLVASFIVNNGEPAARKWAKEVAVNFARPPQGNGLDQLKAMAAGEGDVAIANASDLGYLRFPDTYAELQLGQDIKLAIPFNGGFNDINATCAVVPKGSDVQKAAQFVEFLTAAPAQQIYPSAAHENPVNVMGIPSDFSIEEVGGIKEDPVPLNQLAQKNKLAVQILKEAGW